MLRCRLLCRGNLFLLRPSPVNLRLLGALILSIITMTSEFFDFYSHYPHYKDRWHHLSIRGRSLKDDCE